MRTIDDLESFMIDSSYTFERLDEALWRVTDDSNDLENLMIYVTGNVVNFEVSLFRIPAEPSTALFRRLLELNGTSLIFGAFGIRNDKVILIGALELDNLDRNELQAMVDSMSLATVQHYLELAELIG